MKQLLAFYGGTFDPIHVGHIAIALHASAVLQTHLDLIPAADPPHRASPGADAQHRAAMVALAVQDHSELSLDSRELMRRGPPSYSIDTLRDLRKQHGSGASFAWVIGADSFIGLPTWKDWRELFSLTHFVLADRAGAEDVSDMRHSTLQGSLAGRSTSDPQCLRESPAGKILKLGQPLMPVSATDIRSRIALGLPWRELVKPCVADYIEHHRLYGMPSSNREPT